MVWLHLPTCEQVGIAFKCEIFMPFIEDKAVWEKVLLVKSELSSSMGFLIHMNSHMIRSFICHTKDTEHPSDTTLDVLLAGMHNLESLNIRGCDLLTDMTFVIFT